MQDSVFRSSSVWASTAAVLLLLAGGALGVQVPVANEGPMDDDAGSAGPARFAWLDAGLASRLRAGEEVPIDEIPGFPYDVDALRQTRGSECIGVCPALPYTHIRPGAALGLSQFACTANFVFAIGDRLAIGTAGHCTQPGDSHRTLLVNAQQAIGFRTIGETIFSTGNAGVGRDFALIEIDPRYHDLVDPAVSVVDGPCGWRDARGLSDLVHYYGHAQGWGPGGQVRSGSVIGGSDSSLTYTRLHSGGGGDSGSPVVFAADPGDTLNRKAAAVHTHGFTLGVGLPIGLGTSMAGVFSILDDAGQGGWELVDSPNCL